MPKYHTHDSWDGETNAPSGNFSYDFEVYRYFIRNDWEEVLSHDADGGIRSGSVDRLVSAFSDGVVVYRRCDSYTLAFDEIEKRCPIRWFVR